MDRQSNDMEVLTSLASTQPTAEASTGGLEERGENAAAATFGAAVAAAETALQDLCEQATKSLVRSDLRVSTAFDAIMPEVYAAIVSIEESGSREAFLAAKGVKEHGNVRNKVSPVLKALAQTKHKHVRAWLAKYSCLLGLGLAEKVSPSEFVSWRENMTLEEACKTWRQQQRAAQRLEHEAPGASAFKKLQAAWERVCEEDQLAFLNRNNLLRID